MELLGYFSALIMGSVLGLVGGGGSILAVPILVYLLNIAPSAATGYSLFVVGISALFGAIQYTRSGLIDFKIGSIFAVPAFIGVYLARKFIVPALPEIVFTVGSREITKDSFILSVFAVVMLVAAYSMVRKKSNSSASRKKPINIPLVAFEGVTVGLITGFVGAGGGFLIIPALVVLAGLDMKIAVGTSLFIIAAKSLIGFIGDIQSNPSIDWKLLVVFSLISVLGIFLGTQLSKKISSEKLKPAFGWFVFVMGGWILTKELFL